MYKSSVFTMLLKEKKNALFIIAGTLNLYEHQSTYNPNMPLRDLIYVANLLADIVKDKDLFGEQLVRIPEPQFVTFYNGTKEQPAMEELWLSDAYIHRTDQPQLELCCVVININPGHNEGFMEKCQVLREYMIYVEKVRFYQQTMSLEDALERAIDECIKEHVLEDFLRKQRVEVMSMSVLEFNLEKQLVFQREAGMREGSDQKLISLICRKLKKGKTPECIAEELEEELEIVEKICKVAEKFAPEYDTIKIYEAMRSSVV